MKKFKSFLSYLSISLALALLTIMVLDGFNPMMAFLTSNVSKVLITACCVTAVLNGLLHMHGK